MEVNACLADDLYNNSTVQAQVDDGTRLGDDGLLCCVCAHVLPIDPRADSYSEWLVNVFFRIIFFTVYVWCGQWVSMWRIIGVPLMQACIRP